MYLVDYFADKVSSMNEFSEKKNPLLFYKTAISDFNESADKVFLQVPTANQLIADTTSFDESLFLVKTTLSPMPTIEFSKFIAGTATTP